MAIPPFVNTRLNRDEEPSRRKQEELFDGISRNFEDLYNRFQTVEAQNEAANEFLRLVAKGKHKIAFGSKTLTFPGASRFSGSQTITHGLGNQPAVVVGSCSPVTTLAGIFEAFTVGKTTFEIRAYCAAGEPTAGQTVSASWVAIL